MAQVSIAARRKLQESERKKQSIIGALRHGKSNTDLRNWTSSTLIVQWMINCCVS